MSLASSYDVEEFVEAIRCILGKKPLPEEPPLRFESWQMPALVTLDGQRLLTAQEWAAELRISKQAVSVRLQKVARRRELGEPDPYRGMTTVSAEHRKGQATAARSHGAKSARNGNDKNEERDRIGLGDAAGAALQLQRW